MMDGNAKQGELPLPNGIAVVLLMALLPACNGAAARTQTNRAGF
jgi:hypothetical protein